MQKVQTDSTLLKINDEQIKIWKEKYINLFPNILDNGEVKVFTPACKLISQDARHLTKDGALFFANKIDLNKYLK